MRRCTQLIRWRPASGRQHQTEQASTKFERGFPSDAIAKEQQRQMPRANVLAERGELCHRIADCRGSIRGSLCSNPLLQFVQHCQIAAENIAHIAQLCIADCLCSPFARRQRAGKAALLRIASNPSKLDRKVFVVRSAQGWRDAELERVVHAPAVQREEKSMRKATRKQTKSILTAVCTSQ